MPNGNVDQEAAPGESSLGLYKPYTQLPRTMEGTMESTFPDIIKFVESSYRVEKKKASRAIAGLSMGGYHSLHISKEYPDLFDYVGLSRRLLSRMRKLILLSIRIWKRNWQSNLRKLQNCIG